MIYLRAPSFTEPMIVYNNMINSKLSFNCITLNIGCPIKGQIRKECASHPSCHLSCNNTEPGPCPLVCIINGCECPTGTVIDEEKNECVAPNECTAGMYYSKN